MSYIDLNKALFFDIETHRGKNWDDLSPAVQKAFINHYYDSQTYETPAEHYNEMAGLYAEFSQCICAVYGYQDAVTKEYKDIAFWGADEVDILTKSAKLLDAFMTAGYYLAGHNVIQCDIPYLVKRYIINKMHVPLMLNTWGVKPWELSTLDTMNLWKFGDYKKVSLETICAVLDIPCKTDEIGGGNLHLYDLEDMPWDKLVHYCREDVRSNFKMVEHIVTYFDTADE